MKKQKQDTSVIRMRGVPESSPDEVDVRIREHANGRTSFSIPTEALPGLAGGRREIALGDLVKKVTTALGIKQCDGCKERQRSLNRFKLKF